MEEVDPAFFQAPEHRPNLSITEAQGIPLIDLSLFHEDSSTDYSKLEELVIQIGNACKDWGFFNHGVPLEKREKIEKASREFYSQSLEEKRKIRRDESQVSRYYDTEHTKNVRDWKEVFDVTILEPTIIPASTDPNDAKVAHWTNKWPQHPPQVCQEYAKEVEKLAHELMELIALSLYLPAKIFSGYFKNHTSFIRFNHYPPCPVLHLALGYFKNHLVKDSGALTVLAQDEVGGLEVKNKANGEWVLVKPTHNAYIINVGDIIQAWSNDKYESIKHRAMVNSEKERFSIPCAFNLAHLGEAIGRAYK